VDVSWVKRDGSARRHICTQFGPWELCVRRREGAVGGTRPRCRTNPDTHPRKPPDVLQVQAT
jgi:hypothetical protein